MSLRSLEAKRDSRRGSQGDLKRLARQLPRGRPSDFPQAVQALSPLRRGEGLLLETGKHHSSFVLILLD